MAISARSAVGRLKVAAENGSLAALCERLGIDLLILFGSSASAGTDPQDVDLAIRFSGERSGDLLGLLDGLYDLTEYEGYDLLELRRAGPLARDRALSSGYPLYQARPRAYGNAQIAAMMERMETEKFRRLELEFMR